MAKDGSEKIVFGYAPEGNGAVLLLGIPTSAWEYMKDGKTNTLDLSSIGIPIITARFGLVP